MMYLGSFRSSCFNYTGKPINFNHKCISYYTFWKYHHRGQHHTLTHTRNINSQSMDHKFGLCWADLVIYLLHDEMSFGSYFQELGSASIKNLRVGTSNLNSIFFTGLSSAALRKIDITSPIFDDIMYLHIHESEVLLWEFAIYLTKTEIYINRPDKSFHVVINWTTLSNSWNYGTEIIICKNHIWCFFCNLEN